MSPARKGLATRSSRWPATADTTCATTRCGSPTTSRPTRSRAFAVIRARATENLYRFNLDLRDFLTVSGVTVNFRRASYVQEQGQELVITPRKKIKAGRRMLITVEYAGTPEPVVDPDEAIEGWMTDR